MTKLRDVVEYMRESNESQKRKRQQDVTVYAYERRVERVRKKRKWRYRPLDSVVQKRVLILRGLIPASSCIVTDQNIFTLLAAWLKRFHYADNTTGGQSARYLTTCYILKRAILKRISKNVKSGSIFYKNKLQYTCCLLFEYISISFPGILRESVEQTFALIKYNLEDQHGKIIRQKKEIFG